MSVGSPRPAPITPHDQALLAFLARHRMVRTDHVQTLLGVSASVARARLARLAAAELVVGEVVFHRQPACWQITRRGLAAVGSRLPTPRRDLAGHTHDIGVAWLWLAAREGAFGPLRELYAERELRSADGPGRRPEPGLAVRVGGVGPHGGERLHYPDLLLVSERGQRVAIELELTSKSRTRRELILSAYGADPSIDHVLYLVRDRQVGNAITASARRLGLEGLVHVQGVTLADPTRPPDVSRGAQRSRGRDPGHRGGPGNPGDRGDRGDRSDRGDRGDRDDHDGAAGR
jgi:hypothetical protein